MSLTEARRASRTSRTRSEFELTVNLGTAGVRHSLPVGFNSLTHGSSAVMLA